jgi:hypothetical protein
MTKKAQNTSKAERKAASATPAPAASTTEGQGAENTNQTANPPAGEKEPEKASQDPAQEGSKKEAKEKAGDTADKQIRKRLQPYFDAYPTADKFYVTTDGQPFFEAQWAREHQKSVDPEKKLTIVNR